MPPRPSPPCCAAQDAAVAAASAAADVQLWSRFIDPTHGTVYDHAGLDGTVHISSAEECRLGQPSALAWGCTIEDGAFFGGLYLAGLCRHWESAPDEAVRRRAVTIADGLLKLADLGGPPGFVARGIALDGRSHPSAGSDDQTAPWLYGLWRFLKTDLPSPTQRARALATVQGVVTAIAGYGWQMPCDPLSFGFRGAWHEGNMVHVPRLLFACLAMADLTSAPAWRRRYEACRDERVGKPQRTRLELCGEGIAFQPPGVPSRYFDNPPLWTSGVSIACLRALSELEPEPAVQAVYDRGLAEVARRVLPHVSRYRDFDNDNDLVFDPDWRRVLLPMWQPQADIAAAAALAERQIHVWDRGQPRRRYEDAHMREPLFAAWIVALAADAARFAEAAPVIRAALTHYRWERLYTALFFISQNAAYERPRENRQ